MSEFIGELIAWIAQELVQHALAKKIRESETDYLTH